MKYEFSFFKWFSTVRSWCPFILIDVLQENGRIRMYNNALKVLLQLLWSLLGYPSTWGWFGAHQTHKDSHKPKYLCTIDSAWINGWDYSLVGVSGKQGSTTHIFTRSSLWWVEEQNTHNTTREKRGRRRRSKSLWVGGRAVTFGGCEPICFEPVIGGSNVLGFAPNLVSSFYT